MTSDRFLRIAVCTLAPPFLGGFATAIVTLSDEFNHGRFGLTSLVAFFFIWLPIYSFYAYILMGIQSAVYAFLIDLWVRRLNPGDSVRSHLAFVGYSTLLGGLAGATADWVVAHQWRPIPAFIYIGLGAGLVTGAIVSRWFVERRDATAPASF